MDSTAPHSHLKSLVLGLILLAFAVVCIAAWATREEATERARESVKDFFELEGDYMLRMKNVLSVEGEYLSTTPFPVQSQQLDELKAHVESLRRLGQAVPKTKLNMIELTNHAGADVSRIRIFVGNPIRPDTAGTPAILQVYRNRGETLTVELSVDYETVESIVSIARVKAEVDLLPSMYSP